MKKKIGLIALAIILIIGIVGVAFYFMNNKTPKQGFWSGIEENVKNISSNKADMNLKSMSYAQNGTFKMKMDIKDNETYDVDEMKQIMDGVSKTEAQYEILKDGTTGKLKATINLKYNDSDLLKLDILKANNKLGIKIEEIYSKYFSIENKNLKQLVEKFGGNSTNIPNEIEMFDIYDFISISESDMKHIKDVFTKIGNENIPEEAYSINKNVTVKILDNNVKADEYTLTLTSEQTKNLLIKSLEAIKNDETIMNLIMNKLEMVLKTLRSFEDIPEVTKDDIINEINSAIDDIKAEENIETIKITEYKAGNSSKLVFTFGEEELYSIDVVKNGKETKVNLNSNIEENINNTLITLTKKNENESHVDVVSKINNELADIEETMSYDIELNKKGIEIEDFTDENSININDKTVEELKAIVQEMYLNLYLVVPQKAKLLGIDLSNL